MQEGEANIISLLFSSPCNIEVTNRQQPPLLASKTENRPNQLNVVLSHTALWGWTPCKGVTDRTAQLPSSNVCTSITWHLKFKNSSFFSQLKALVETRAFGRTSEFLRTRAENPWCIGTKSFGFVCICVHTQVSLYVCMYFNPGLFLFLDSIREYYIWNRWHMGLLSLISVRLTTDFWESYLSDFALDAYQILLRAHLPCQAVQDDFFFQPIFQWQQL